MFSAPPSSQQIANFSVPTPTPHCARLLLHISTSEAVKYRAQYINPNPRKEPSKNSPNHTLVREVQKDMADVKGDRAAGCRTVPIAWGMRCARTLALVHTGIIVAGLLMVRAVFLRDSFSFWYIGIGIIGPLLLSAGFTYQASDRAEHVRAGNLMKLAMVMAVAFAFLIRYLP